MTIYTEVIQFDEWQKMDGAVRAALSIRGTFYSGFDTFDYGVAARELIESLDQSTDLLRLTHTKSGEEKLVIFALSHLDKETAASLGAFWDTDTATLHGGSGYKFDRDVLTRLRSIIKHEEEHERAKS